MALLWVPFPVGGQGGTESITPTSATVGTAATSVVTVTVRTVDEMAHAWVNVTYMDDEDFEAAEAERAVDEAHASGTASVRPGTQFFDQDAEGA